MFKTKTNIHGAIVHNRETGNDPNICPQLNGWTLRVDEHTVLHAYNRILLKSVKRTISTHNYMDEPQNNNAE